MNPSTTASTKKSVREFWQAEACGERYGDEQELIRYRLEPEIVSFADFDGAAGLEMLEIGTGMGADFSRFAASSHRATGIDLTNRAAELTRDRLRSRDLRGSVCVGDSEQLPFRSGAFDLVYSWGVLHHTPRTQEAINEAHRVLKRGGKAKIMLYHRHSWNALAAWAGFCLLRGRPFRGLKEAVAQIESPGTQAFTKKEALDLFSRFEEVTVRTRLTHWDKKRAPGISKLTGDRFGWFLLIEAKKARSPLEKM